jgi:hypothetical protein
MKFGFFKRLRDASLDTLVPRREAMLESVSPGRTV